MFAEKLRSIIHSFGRGSLPTGNIQGLAASPSHIQPSNQQSPRQNSTSQPRQNVQQSSGSSPIQAIQGNSQGSGTTTGNGSSNHRLLFVARKGLEYKLAQLEVTGHTCHTFFRSMKNEYFSMRGALRKWLSVWRYNHCDFYKVCKWWV